MLKRIVIDSGVGVAFALIFKWSGKLSFKLGENAVTSWIDDAVAKTLDIDSPSVAKIMSIISDWGAPLGAAVAVLLFYHWVQRKWFAAPAVPVSGEPSKPIRDSHIARVSPELLEIFGELRAIAMSYRRCDRAAIPILGAFLMRSPIWEQGIYFGGAGNIRKRTGNFTDFAAIATCAWTL